MANDSVTMLRDNFPKPAEEMRLPGVNLISVYGPHVEDYSFNEIIKYVRTLILIESNLALIV